MNLLVDQELADRIETLGSAIELFQAQMTRWNGREWFVVADSRRRRLPPHRLRTHRPGHQRTQAGSIAALGILDEALTLDLRRPQDYFHRTWSTAFRARDLAALQASGPDATGKP